MPKIFICKTFKVRSATSVLLYTWCFVSSSPWLPPWRSRPLPPDFVWRDSSPFFSPSKRHTLFHVTLLRDTQKCMACQLILITSSSLKVERKKTSCLQTSSHFLCRFFLPSQVSTTRQSFFPLIGSIWTFPVFLTHSFQHYTPKEERKKVNWVTVSCRLTLPKRWLLLKGSLWRS